jgi:hypothetical protein
MPGGLRHHSLNLVGAVLVLIGLGMSVRGGALALRELGAIYEANTTDPLATPEISEEERGERMLSHAIWALAGLVPVGAGVVVFAVGRGVRRRAKRQAMRDSAVMRDTNERD